MLLMGYSCPSVTNSSSKPGVRHSLLKELNLAASDFTPRKQELYYRIWRKESALCKLRKKYRSRKLKEQCDVEISNSLNTEAARLLAAIFRDSRYKPTGRRWNFEGKNWLYLSLSVVENVINFFRHYSLFHQDEPYNPSSILFILGLASIHVFDALRHSVQKMSEIDRYCCLLFDEMSVRECKV
jgi:hypothetical protein